MSAPPMMTMQASAAESVILALGSFLGIVLLGGLAVFGARRMGKWLNRDGPTGFTLGDLREMLASGDITESEFRAARDAMIARVKKQSAAKPAVETGSSRKAHP
ncbi:MAG: SHOCT domain-containing protein [Phycisphaerales bacterium]|nr:SHOCT domain-containing protein [Phycisphaerales bacterium]